MYLDSSYFIAHHESNRTILRTLNDSHLILAFFCMEVYISPFIIQVSQFGSELLGPLSRE